MPVFGLNNGMVPIIAYNYGARNRARIVQTVKLSALAAVGIMLCGFLLFQLRAGWLLGLFEASEEVLAIGVPALRTISTSFIFAGFCIVCGSVFQAIGHGVLSMINSIVRQLVVLLPAAFLLSLTGKLELVWFSFPIAEVFSFALSVIFLRRLLRTVIDPLERD